MPKAVGETARLECVDDYADQNPQKERVSTTREEDELLCEQIGSQLMQSRTRCMPDKQTRAPFW